MRLIEHFYKFIAPHDCVACGIEGSLLCMGCSEIHLKMIPSGCYRCKAPTDRGLTCASCRIVTPLAYVWTRTVYNQAARKLVHELKFNYARAAAETIALELATVMPRLRRDIIIVHVPAATTHVRQRGFDQSALICRELSRYLGSVHVHALKRMGQQRQVGSTGTQRRTQLQDAFRVVSPVRGARVLLVDDVLTTGSTFEAAAKALRHAGALEVYGAAFAKAVQ